MSFYCGKSRRFYLDTLFLVWPLVFFFFFNDTATTEIYTLSLHDALPICSRCTPARPSASTRCSALATGRRRRSEEHTSELQSQSNLVCRLLLEKKKLIEFLKP